MTTDGEHKAATNPACGHEHPNGYWRCKLPRGHYGTHSDRVGREWGLTTNTPGRPCPTCNGRGRLDD